ncbi:MAG TPA: hypothetical protein PLZ94_18880, partial [Armatimonadota bacterium]|nr:hypothetical protein [Armatimonadota bacterium]
GASPPSHRRFETSGSIPNPARQGFARKQRGDLSPRAGLRPASQASDSLCRNLSGLSPEPYFAYSANRD